MKRKTITHYVILAIFLVVSITSNAVTTKTVGASGADYTSVATAISTEYSAADADGLVIVLNSDYNQTTEAISTVATSGKPVTIRPAATLTVANTAWTISGSYITVDGRIGGTGSTQSLTLANTGATNTAASTTLTISRSNVNVQYVNVQGRYGATLNLGISAIAGGIITVSGSAVTVDHCNIGDDGSGAVAANYPICGIYSASAGTNTVSNNNFINVFSGYTTNTSDASAILLNTNATGWSITGNSFYNTFSSAINASQTRYYYNINIASGSGYTISNNYIGGQAALCSGGKMLLGSSATRTNGFNYRAISLTPTGTITKSTISGNTIANFALCTGIASQTNIGIYVSTGAADITNNVIGSTSSLGNITFEADGTASIQLLGINTAGSGDKNITGNSIGGITCSGISTGKTAFTSIYNASSGNIIIDGNTIGSTAIGITTGTSMSIQNAYKNGTTPLSNGVGGIKCGDATAATIAIIRNNVIANMYGGNNLDAGIVGMECGNSSSGTSTFQIYGNTVRDLLSDANCDNVWTSTGIFFYCKTATTANSAIYSNNIYNITSTNTTAANYIYGISVRAKDATMGVSIYKNNIYNITSPNKGYGINIGDPGANSRIASTLIYNNFIRLGQNADGTDQTNDVDFKGINDTGGSTTVRNTTSYIYFNTIYLTGTVTSGSTNTYAMYGYQPNAAREIKDNIFDNRRTGGTGKHIALGLLNATSTTSNYNDFISTSGYIGELGGTAKPLLTDWKASLGEANSVNTTPVYVNATTTTPDLHLTATGNSGILGQGTAIASVTTDFDGETRTLPPGIGADEPDITTYTATWDGTQWVGTTPTTGVNALISGAYNNLPGFTCNNLKIQAATTFNSDATINGDLRLYNNLSIGSSILTLKGNTAVWGSSIDASAGSVVFSGTSAQSASSITINNLTVNNSAGVTISSPFTIATGATIVCTAGSLSAIPTFGTTLNVTYNGTSQQTTSNEVPISGTTVNLTINNSAGVKLGADLTCNNIALTLGNLIANGKNITITGSTSGAGNIDCSSPNQSVNYNGTSAQNISNFSSIYNMNVNNSAGVTFATNLTVRNTLTINSGAALSVAAGKQLTATSTLSNSGTLNLLSTAAAGTATILTPGAIGGTGGVVNVQQYLASGRNWYISSPVSGATSNVFNAAAASNINKLYRYDEPNGSSATLNWPQISDNTTSLSVAKGYVANVDASLLAATNGVTFTGGSLNTGNITTGLNSVPALTSTPAAASYQGYNLVGNPYPSYLNAMTAINNAGNLVIDPTIWYRTQAVSSTYYFETVNTSGNGVGTNNALTGTVTGYIPPMQAFWVHVVSGASSPALTFSNSMRSHAISVSGTPTTLLKAPATKNAVQQTLRLKVSNGTNGDEAIVYFNSNASNDFDAYDSRKMSNNNPAIPEIYTTVGSEKLVINGMNSISANTELPLGFTTGQSNTFSIKASEFSNFDANTKVYLKDKLSGTEYDLTDGTAYTFASDITSTADRFSLVFKSAGVATSLNNASGDQVALIYKNANNQITVNCKGDISDNAFISVYNALGQKLESKQITSTTTVIGKTFTSGVYVVTVNNGGKNTTKKVILN